MRVDGRGSGMSDCLSARRPAATVEGFYRNSALGALEMPFVFAAPRHEQPAASAAADVPAASSVLGTVSVKFRVEGACLGLKPPKGHGDRSVEPAPSLQEVDGMLHCAFQGPARPAFAAEAVPGATGKKWWTLPTLTTQAGPARPYTRGTYPRRYAEGPELANLCVRLETATTLRLRGVLSEDDPAHAALLALDSPPAIPAAAQNTGPGSVQQPARALAVKRELIALDEEPPSQRARTVAVVDLT